MARGPIPANRRPVFAHGIATANPPHLILQEELRDLMAGSARIETQRLERLLGVFANAGVKRRHAALPLEELGKRRGWPARNAAFVETAEILLAETNRHAISQAGLEPADIDFVVSVTTTGTAIPDMSARQVGMIGLRHDVRRVPIYGFGCAGGATGLAHAATVARAFPGSNVLMQAAELCLVHLDPHTSSEAHFVASALFGDGVASMVLSTEGPGLLSIGSSSETIVPDTSGAMAWTTGDSGLDVVLGAEVPSIVGSQIGPIARAFLTETGRTVNDFDSFVAHPGSLKVIEAIEDSLGLPEGTLTGSREILADYGNMSSVTVYFILEKALRSNGPFLMMAVGPGVTVAAVEGEISVAA